MARLKRGSIGRLAAAVFLAAILWLPRASAGERVYTEVFFFSTADLMLAYSATANAWYPLALQGSEMIRGSQYGDRVIVVATTQRILGFSSVYNRWVFVESLPNEEFLQVDARGDVGWVITSKRSLGFSAFTGDWAEVDLSYEEHGGYGAY